MHSVSASASSLALARLTFGDHASTGARGTSSRRCWGIPLQNAIRCIDHSYQGGGDKPSAMTPLQPQILLGMLPRPYPAKSVSCFQPCPEGRAAAVSVCVCEDVRVHAGARGTSGCESPDFLMDHAVCCDNLCTTVGQRLGISASPLLLLPLLTALPCAAQEGS